jgi:hypothetical protein
MALVLQGIPVVTLSFRRRVLALCTTYDLGDGGVASRRELPLRAASSGGVVDLTLPPVISRVVNAGHARLQPSFKSPVANLRHVLLGGQPLALVRVASFVSPPSTPVILRI